jgi:hypothetical protein
MKDGCAPRAPAQSGYCREPHVTLTLRPMDDEFVGGAHLRRQRRLGGFSVKSLADAAHLSPTRVRQLEASERVTARAAGRYLTAIEAAWRARAEETALAERDEAS